MKNLTLIAIMISLLCLSSCKRETEVSGEVFVVTQGAGNYKFGLVQIDVLPLEETRQNVLAKRSDVFKALSPDTLRTTFSNCLASHRPYESDEFDRKRSYDECGADRDNAEDEAVGLYFSGLLAQPVAKGETDSDGKFILKVPKPGKYAVAASATRKVGADRVEKYYWLVEVDLDGTAKKITLSNNNMIQKSVPPLGVPPA